MSAECNIHGTDLSGDGACTECKLATALCSLSEYRVSLFFISDSARKVDKECPFPDDIPDCLEEALDNLMSEIEEARRLL